jgi:peptidyl-dipeptidase Dcp
VAAVAAERQKRMRRNAKLVDQEGGNFKIEPWDWWYYAEKVRKAD